MVETETNMMSTSTMIFVIGCFLLMFFGQAKSASNRRCLPVYDGGSFCFTQPDPPVALSWYEAQRWCKNINATLPITDTAYHMGVYQNALSYFGLQTETVWLGANFTYDPNNWLWTDGTPFEGTIEEANSTEKSHAYVMRNGSDLKFFADSPRDRKGYLCGVDYSELNCASSDATFWTNGRCFYKYNSYYYGYTSWYSFRSNCQQSKTPSYNELKELTRWLDDGQQFWIAVRCGFWEWQNLVIGRSFEVTGSELPSVAYEQCMASTRTSYSSSNCSRNLQFVCFEHVNVGRFETTTDESTTINKVSTANRITTDKSTTVNKVSTANRITTDKSTTINKARNSKKSTTADPATSMAYNRGFTSDDSDRYQGSYRDYRQTDYPLVIGLSVGGGIVLLAVITWLVIIAVRGCRRNRAGNYSSVDLRRQVEYSHPRTTSNNAFDNYTFNAASETVDRSGTRNQYKPMNPAANEYVY